MTRTPAVRRALQTRFTGVTILCFECGSHFERCFLQQNGAVEVRIARQPCA